MLIVNLRSWTEIILHKISTLSHRDHFLYLCFLSPSLFSLSVSLDISQRHTSYDSLNANVRNLFWQRGSEIDDKIDVNSHLARSSRRWLLPGGSPGISLFHAPLTLSRLSLTFLLFPPPKLRVYPFVKRREYGYEHVRTDDATGSNGSDCCKERTTAVAAGERVDGRRD